MGHRKPYLAISAVLSASILLIPAVTRADAIADFYEGKTITVVVSAGASGTYGIFAQLMNRHFSRFIPGKPSVVPSYMPGGGGTKAANYVYNVAAKDGSVIATLHDYTINAQVLRPNGVKYKSDEFKWIGRFVRSDPVIVVMRESGARTVEDAKSRTLTMGSTGKSAPSYVNMSLMNTLIGTKFKIITGYKGRGPVEAAMERGELQGSSANWMTWTTGKPHWVESGRIVPLVQAGQTRLRELPDVPTLIELAANDADRKLLQFIASGGALGRSVSSLPAIPKERLIAPRRAFDAMVSDPVFVGDARKRGVTLDTETGEEMQKMVQRTMALGPDVMERARKLFGK